MHVELTERELRVELNFAEKLLALRFRPLVFARDQVLRAERELPASSWRELRAPGTYVPGVVKAGTYYTARGKEFWCVRYKQRERALSIELDRHPLRRLVLTLPNCSVYERLINDWARTP